MEYWGRRDHRIRFDSAEVVYVTAIGRTTAGINKAEAAGTAHGTSQIHRCVAAGIPDDGGQLSRFMVRFVRRQQETGRTNCRLSWGTPPRKVKADTWPSRKASVVSAGYAFTKQPSLWGRSMTKQWVFCSTPPMTTRASPKSHWAWPGAWDKGTNISVGTQVVPGSRESPLLREPNLDFVQKLDTWRNRRTSCCGWPTDILHCRG